jgi:hypothetical protein
MKLAIRLKDLPLTNAVLGTAQGMSSIQLLPAFKGHGPRSYLVKDAFGRDLNDMAEMLKHCPDVEEVFQVPDSTQEDPECDPK